MSNAARASNKAKMTVKSGTAWFIGPKDTVYAVDWTGQPPGPWGGPRFQSEQSAKAEVAARLRRSIEAARAHIKNVVAVGEADIAEYERRLMEVEKGLVQVGTATKRT